MYFKLALQNVKKRWRDYTIYAMSLTLAIALFYSFHSLESQKVFELVQLGSQNYLDIVFQGLDLASVLVALILGSLIVYANQIALKKRTKELGLYLLLGMGKQKIAIIFMFEALVVGLISLLCGLGLGIFGSYLLSHLSIFLFEIPMEGFGFNLSLTAIVKTIGFFGLLYGTLLHFYSRYMANLKIITLLRMPRTNQKVELKYPYRYWIAFIIACMMLCSAYGIILEVGLDPSRFGFLLSIILGFIGTFLWFYGFGAIIIYLQNNERWYFKGLRSFNIRQLTSKYHTHYRSMGVICLLLFVTLGVLSTGLSVKSALEKDLAKSTPFDATYSIFLDGSDISQLNDVLNSEDFPLTEVDTVTVDYYTDFYLALSDILVNVPTSKIVQDTIATFENYALDLISQEDYNRIRILLGEEPIAFATDQIVVNTNMEEYIDVFEEILSIQPTFEWRNQTYRWTQVETLTIRNDMRLSGFPLLVVPDTLLEEVHLQRTDINIMYHPEQDKTSLNQTLIDWEEAYQERYQLHYEEGEQDMFMPYLYGSTRYELYLESRSMSTLVLFISLYLGLVFLIASMALLSIQLLHEAQSSKDNYQKLMQLGATKQEIKQSIYQQITVYFALPISLAIVHSTIGIHVVNNYIAMYNKPDIRGSSLVTIVIFGGVFACYLFATMQGYLQIVFQKQQ